MTTRMLGCLVLAAGLVGCASSEPTTPQPPRWEVVSTVLESPRHGPELCLGSMEESLPPQCSGVPVAGWEWSAVDGEESVNGTTWGGDYRLVGTYDGTTFTPTSPAEPAPAREPSPPMRAACDQPQADEPAAPFERIDKAAFEAATSRAQASPDFAGLWVTGENRSLAPDVRLDGLVLNVAFTSELERHTAELREVWGGLLCVEQLAHTEAELRQVQDQLPAAAEELGLELRSTSTDVLDNVVDLTVVAVTPEQRAALDERFGEGLVEVTALIRPLSG